MAFFKGKDERAAEAAEAALRKVEAESRLREAMVRSAQEEVAAQAEMRVLSEQNRYLQGARAIEQAEAQEQRIEEMARKLTDLYKKHRGNYMSWDEGKYLRQIDKLRGQIKRDKTFTEDDRRRIVSRATELDDAAQGR